MYMWVMEYPVKIIIRESELSAPTIRALEFHGEKLLFWKITRAHNYLFPILRKLKHLKVHLMKMMLVLLLLNYFDKTHI